MHALSLIRKQCFEKVGTFDEHLPSLEDWELYIRISEYYEFKFIDEPLNMHYLSEDSLTRNLPSQLYSTEKIIEKHFDEFNKQKKATANIYGFLASQLCLNGQLGKGRTYFIKAIKENPANILYYSGFLISLLGLKGYKKFLGLIKRTYN